MGNAAGTRRPPWPLHHLDPGRIRAPRRDLRCVSALDWPLSADNLHQPTDTLDPASCFAAATTGPCSSSTCAACQLRPQSRLVGCRAEQQSVLLQAPLMSPASRSPASRSPGRPCRTPTLLASSTAMRCVAPTDTRCLIPGPCLRGRDLLEPHWPVDSRVQITARSSAAVVSCTLVVRGWKHQGEWGVGREVRTQVAAKNIPSISPGAKITAGRIRWHLSVLVPQPRAGHSSFPSDTC